LLQNWDYIMWTVLGVVAVLVFIQVWAYYEDPDRKEINDEWFEAFEEYVKERYREGGLGWRAGDLSMHFGKADTDKKTLSAWFKSKMSIFK